MTHSRRSVLGFIASGGVVDVIPANSPRDSINHVSPSAPALEFRDQESAGGSVIIATATLTDAGFVVVQDDENEIIGVSEYLTAGQHNDLEIVPDRPLFESGELVAVIQLDTNENQRFDATMVKSECGQRDEEGALVSDTATVTLPQFSNAAIVFEDQDAADSVVVTAATLPEGGWIVVAVGEDDDPRFGETQVVGQTDFFDPGHYEEIEVPLDEFPKPADCEERMEALLLRDTNDNREYEFDYHFPNQDTPYAPGGVDTATVSYTNC